MVAILSEMPEGFDKNTISSEKNNSQIKCKVHKITTNISNNNIKMLNVSNYKYKNVKKKITNLNLQEMDA